jgi:hypothetical protein
LPKIGLFLREAACTGQHGFCCPDSVPRSRRAQQFARIRRQAIAKLSALVFIALILLPFTAPFPTFPIDPGHSRPYEALPKEFKNKLDSDDGLILPVDVRVSLPGLSELPFRVFAHSHQVSSHTLHHTILRV